MSSHESFIWLNGTLLPNHEARVSPSDHGFTVGDGAFETMRSYDGTIFAVTRHWVRLTRSCEVLGIQPPSKDEFQGAMQATLTASGLRDARVRFTVSSGEGPQGSGRGDAAPTKCCVVASVPVYGVSERVVTAPWTRNERGALSGVKSTSYAENVIALAHAKRHDAGEAIFANTRGELCEGTGTNVFVIQHDTVHTPPLSSGCLAGITRGLVIDLCRTHGIPVSEEPLPFPLLAQSPEAFLTSSTREVHAISHVDGKTISQTVGPLTQRIAGLFRELVSNDADPRPTSH